MELEYKDIRLVKIGPDFCLDTLYANEAYDKPFVIETTYGTVHTVELVWEQGRNNNYRFAIGSGDDGYVLPKYVAYIEVR
ncbi:hypothetical protein [Enterobacter phage fGh-Ecl01]|nr:hypothetical protein [Enterobacter phage fGh-Ecl01]